MTGDILLDATQIASATGIPKNAILNMAERGMIPAENVGKASLKFWRVPLSRLDDVRASYEEYKRLADAKRGESVTRAAIAKNERLDDAERQIARLDRIVARLCSELGSSACEES